jgi:CRP/FNR family transcriptional regulator, cyclic AMP receptor protein
MAAGSQPALGQKSQSRVTDADIATLCRSWFLDGLPVASVRRLAGRGSVRVFGAGQVLWTAGSVITELHIVLEGEVRAVRSKDGRQHVVHTEGPGGTLGDVPLFAGGGAPATVIVPTAARCLAFSRLALEAATIDDPALAWCFLRQLGARVRLLVERLDAVTVHSVSSRLASFLLEHASSRGFQPVVSPGLTQTQMAEELGTVREMIVRALRTLRKAGVIAPAGRGRVRIVDRRALMGVAGRGSDGR